MDVVVNEASSLESRSSCGHYAVAKDIPAASRVPLPSSIPLLPLNLSPQFVDSLEKLRDILSRSMNVLFSKNDSSSTFNT